MKTTLCLALALIAASLSARAQSTQSIGLAVYSGTKLVCGVTVTSLNADLQTVLVKGAQILQNQPITVKTASDSCTGFLMTTGLVNPITSIQIGLSEVNGTTFSKVTMTLSNVYVASITSESLSNGEFSQEIKLYPTTLRIYDSLLNTTVTCEFAKQTCS
jgi:hypothetical protein